MPKDTPRSIPDFALTHGQARWVLVMLFGGAGQPDMDTAFDAYLKYLRREGVPFAPDEVGVGRGNRMVYRYEHLMELAVALFLRSQAILPKHVVSLLASSRDELRPIYRRALIEADSGLGRSVPIMADGKEVCAMSGVSLDLGLSFSSGVLMASGHPEAIGPEGLIFRMATHNRRHRFRDPIPLSDLALEVVELAPNAPTIQRGRH